MQVLDYENTAAAVLPLVAASYVFHAMGAKLWAAYTQYEADRERNNFDDLPHLHALSSGMKAVTTGVTADGIEECRRTCGGHGYSQLSGLPNLCALPLCLLVPVGGIGLRWFFFHDVLEWLGGLTGGC